jgi:hemerythrin-like metal-binding protein
MNSLPWETRYATGIAAIDLQHRVLRDLTNRLGVVGKTADEAAIGRAFEDLMRYAEFHFMYEERLLDAWNYPGLPSHVVEHARLLPQLATVGAEVTEGRLPLDEKVVSFLEGWLVNHIMGADMNWVPYAKDQIGYAPEDRRGAGRCLEESRRSGTAHCLWPQSTN